MSEIRACKKHGDVIHHRVAYKGSHRYRCKICMLEAVKRRQQKVKATLVEEFGGCCQVCGYNRYQGALQFHHRNPAERSFGVHSGTGKGLDALRAEAQKCILVCANCHAEIHGGVTNL